MAEKIKISIIIPAFNEEKRLPVSLPSGYKLLKDMLESFELIFVDDGSSDRTKQVLEDFANGKDEIKVYSYPKNQGKGFAVKYGIEKANGKIIGFTDADFAIDLNALKEAFALFEQGFDIVVGDRKSKYSKLENNPDLLRRLLSYTHTRINNFFLELGPIKDTLCGFKFFKAEVAKALFKDLRTYRWFFDLEILIKARKRNFKIYQLPVSWKEVRGSQVKFFSMVRTSIKEHLVIYANFFNARIFSALTIILLFTILAPFLISPQNLTKRNGDFSDLVWPDYYFIRDSVYRYHQFPLWNPTLFGGIPEVANPQSPLIYPPNILVLVLPIDYAIVILAFLHLFISAIFLYQLGVKILKWNNFASITLSYIFLFSPFLWSKLAIGHLSMFFAITLIGPIIYYAAKLYKESNVKDIFLLGLFLSLQYLNYPTIWFYTLFFGIPVFSYISISLYKSFRKIIRLLISVIFSVILISPVLFVQFKAASYITRSSLSLSELSIPLWSLKRFLISFLVPSNFLNELETEVWIYLGSITLLISFLGWLKIRSKIKVLTLFLMVLVILITLGSRTPVFPLFTKYIPFFSFLRVSTRDWFILIPLISFLAAYFMQVYKSRFRIFVLVVIVSELFIFSLVRFWSVPGLMQYNVNSNLAKLLNKSEEGYRYYCTTRCLSARETLTRQINNADGYHLIILKNYRDALAAAGGFNSPKYTGNLPTTQDYGAQPNAKLLGEFSVKYLISPYPLKDINFKLISQSGIYYLYKNELAKPRIRMDNNQSNKLEILKDTPNEIVVKTFKEEGNLIIADSYYPGWKAFIDNNPVNIYEKDSWSRLIKVPKGDHLIKIIFEPYKI